MDKLQFLVLIIIIGTFYSGLNSKNYCKDHCSEGAIMTRKGNIIKDKQFRFRGYCRGCSACVRGWMTCRADASSVRDVIAGYDPPLVSPTFSARRRHPGRPAPHRPQILSICSLVRCGCYRFATSCSLRPALACAPACPLFRPSVRRVMRTAFCIIDIDTAAAAAAAAAKERQASVIGTGQATA